VAYIPEMVMNCDDDYVNKSEKYKCWGIPSMETYFTSIMIREKRH
jgi:hypothetical protein